MRIAICASVLGFCCAGGFAQVKSVGCPEPNWAVIHTAWPSFSRTSSAPAVLPSRSLQMRLPPAPDLTQSGTNRNAIQRAIRALTNRVFPGRRSFAASGGSDSRAHATFAGAYPQFHFGAPAPCSTRR